MTFENFSQLHDSARESEEGSVDIAKLRMCNAELHGRVSEGEQRLQQAAAALEEEQAEHSETQRKLRDAMALLDRARAEQRELVQVHTKAIEEQHSKEAQELQRQGAEQVRKAEDRIRELQREVVAKEDQRAAMARHAEALESKLMHAQEEARAYLKTVEGTTEKHKAQQQSKEDAMRKVQERVQELEREMMARQVEHKREREKTCSELQRAAQLEKEKLVSERREAERKLAADHRAELDKVQQALRAQGDGEVLLQRLCVAEIVRC